MPKKLNSLTPEEQSVILNRGTERPFTGKYNDCIEIGIYVCKQCSSPLYHSDYKFPSRCGWPSFDDEFEGAIRRQRDTDDSRVEIVCAQCEAHLGHIFEGEQFTPKNIRHCVNSISIVLLTQEDFEAQNPQYKRAYFAGGCFWGVEHLMQQRDGVLNVISGYMGGHVDSPTYEEVCRGDTGHIEVVEVFYDSTQVTFETLAKYFFEIHDPTQPDGQGSDRGSQYLSTIFYSSASEKKTSKDLIQQLNSMGLKVATKLIRASSFWKAEAYHQDYYEQNGKAPYCHHYQKRFPQ